MKELTEFEKNAIICLGSEFLKEGNDPYQTLANTLGVTRNVAKSKYYQFLYTNVESVVCRSHLKESFVIQALLSIMKVHGEERKQTLNDAMDLADNRYRVLVKRHKEQTRNSI